MINMEFLREFGIDIDKSLELLGDIETYNEILNDFYSELDEKITNLRNYKNDNDMENYSILVHALKGECKYLGFNNLADICYLHQLKSEENNINYINDNFEELLNETNKIKDIVAKYLATL